MILQRVHASSEALDAETRFAAWLHRVARNAVIDHHPSSSPCSRVVEFSPRPR